ncbi:hypothetical protein CQA38_08110 [Campylobacter sp. MIT 12-5580]|uniref:tetratricopeptide repeat protein n=1 Tax=Campylobacter sp. MIT 12-5580 TaxID=2040651 RepID=UPI0010F53EC6|nr:tetratricopeptide repeat protein [Campylobacter sp. MIT 12-5580]TKX28324.1 hypothetical protein CQA38_08110 [Campylobacter sp. MIT 12-5580]
MKKIVFILFLLCGVNLLWANDSRDEFMQDYNACKNKDEQSCKKLISLFEPRCNDESLSQEDRGFACSVVAVAYDFNEKYHEAASFFQKGCNFGHGAGCAELGILYYEGWGVRQSFEKAASFTQKACDLGHGFGCGQIARLYALGEGVKQDFKKSFSFAQKGCDLNDALGCGILGILYEGGWGGVKQNKAKAKEYFGKACDLGEQVGCDGYKRLNSK